MKSYLYSSPSSSYCSTANLTNCISNSKSSPSGCCYSLLRRFLGLVNVTQQPFAHIKETQHESVPSESFYPTNAEEHVDETGDFGIVARLMGLDSMPRDDRKNSESITRSRSMNSVDSWREFEPKQGKHLRVKSSTLSEGEASSISKLGNDKFFVISFKNGGEIEEFGSELENSEIGFVELKQRKTERCRSKRREKVRVNEMNKENQEPYKNSQTVWGLGKSEDSRRILQTIKDSKENSRDSGEVIKQSKHMQPKSKTERGKLRKNKKENCSPVEKVETECDSQNSSPVSVLDYVQFPVNTQVLPSEKDTRLASSNSRRKLSEKLESHVQNYCSNTKTRITDLEDSDDSEEKRIERKLSGLRWKESKNDNHEELWGEICRLAENDMLQLQFNFMSKGKKKLDDFEKIGEDFGSQILDQLLFELVDQLIFI